MPNYPSIYLELQELWKKIRNNDALLTGIAPRVDALEDKTTCITHTNDPYSATVINCPVTASNGISSSLGIFNTLTSSDIYVDKNLYVNGTASIKVLNTIIQDSLQVGDKYITIMTGSNTHAQLDGAGILYGSGSTDGTTGDQGSVAYVLYRHDDDVLEIFPGLHVSGALSVSNGITGSFKGNGSQLTNLPLSGYATLTGVSGTFVTNNAATSSLAFLTASNKFTTNQTITGSLYVSSAVSASTVTASNFRASNIPTSTQTNVVVVDGNGVFGKTTLTGLGGVGGSFSGILSGTMPNAISLIGTTSSVGDLTSSIPISPNGKDTVELIIDNGGVDFNIVGSTGGPLESGGDVGIVAGDGGSSRSGGKVVVQGGSAGFGSFGSSPNGGDVYLQGGTSSAGIGGNIYIRSGDGADAAGRVYFDVGLSEIIQYGTNQPDILLGTNNFADIQANGNIYPKTTDIFDLGSVVTGDNRRWNNIYTKKITATSGSFQSIVATTGSFDKINSSIFDLEDCEQGTWIPYIQNPGSPSSFSNYGKYVKIGNNITLYGFVFYNVDYDFSSGAYISLIGLPYVSNRTYPAFISVKKENGAGASDHVLSAYVTDDGYINIASDLIGAHRTFYIFATYETV